MTIRHLGYLDSCGQGIEYDHYKKNYCYLVNDQGQSKRGGGHVFLLLFFVPISHVITKVWELGEHQWNKI